MLQVNRVTSIEGNFQSAAPPIATIIEDLAGVVRRRIELFGGIMAISILGAIVYILTAQPMFTSTAKLVIDTSKIQAFQQQGMSVLGEPQIDAPMVDSQVEIIKSSSVARAVIEDLNLIEDPEFVDDDQRAWKRLLNRIRGAFATQRELDKMNRALGRFSEQLVAGRVGTTYVIAVSFSSRDAAKAAHITNAVVDAYIRGQLDTKSQATRQAGKWLEDRLAELRTQTQAADRAVQDFKANSNIIETPQGLVSEQQLAEVSTQLTTARAQTEEARARFAQVTEILSKHLSDAAITDAVRSDVISRLRQQYLDLSLREAELSNRVSSNHPALVYLRNEMQGIQQAIRQELQRIGETYRGEFEIAHQREIALQSRLETITRQTAQTNQDRVILRELESRAQTYRALADAFLQRFTVAVQQESFPVTGAHTISAAATGTKSHPKTLLILAAASVGGALISYSACLLRDQLDRAIRTSAQVEETLGFRCLGQIPRIKTTAGMTSFIRKFDYQALLDKRVDQYRDRDGPQKLSVDYAIEHPLSDFAEAIRILKVSLDQGFLASNREVLGITSLYSGEGKSVIAANLALFSAITDQRVLLIDCDLHNASLSSLMAPKAEVGLFEVLCGAQPLDKVLRRDAQSGLSFLPLVGATEVSHRNLLISSARMQPLLEQVRAEYDVVVLDLPPLVPLANVRAVSKAVDRIAVVVEWGRSRTDAVKNALLRTDALGGKISGVIINKVDMRKVGRFEGPDGAGHHTRDS